jgi:peptidoglycan/xylan/chitin deacetylase (PgdA/CDA1 family)
VTVLAYHQVDRRRDFAWNMISPERLADQAELLRRRGYRGVCLKEHEERCGNGMVGLTFDDGLAGVVRFALPVLRQLGFRATLFVPTAWVGRWNEWDTRLGGRRVRHATWKEIREAAAAGWEIGSHGHTHRDLMRLPEEEVRRELRCSRRLIRQETGMEAMSIAYPFGRVSEGIVRMAEQEGFRWGCVSVARSEGSDPYRIGRVGVRRFDTEREFLAKVEGGALYPWQVWKDRIASFVARGTPVILHRLRRV